MRSRIRHGLAAAGIGTALLASCRGRCAAADGTEMNAGDTAWLLMSTALVMVMLPGLALFYGGLVRRKNVLSTIMHSFFGLALVSVVWVLVGFSLAFAPDVGGFGLIGGLDFVGFNGVGLEPSAALRAPTIPFVLFATLPADVRGHHAGAHHRRLRRAQALRRLRALHDPLVDPRLLAAGPLGLGAGGWLFELGALDFAGGTVVHITSGVSALVVALVIGRRVANGERHGAARRADDRPRRRPPVVRLVRLQRRLGARRRTASPPTRFWSPTWPPPRRPSPGSWRATSTAARSASSAPRLAPWPASWRSPRRPGFVTVGGALVIGLVAGGLCYSATLLRERAARRRRARRLRGPRRGRHVRGGRHGRLRGRRHRRRLGLIEGNVEQVGIQIARSVHGRLRASHVRHHQGHRLVLGLRVEASEEVGLDLAVHGEVAYQPWSGQPNGSTVSLSLGWTRA